MIAYRFGGFYIPARMMPALRDYIERGAPVGNFLSAVLENDLAQACGRADSENLRNLPAFVAYLYNEAPSECHGSSDKVRAWKAHGGLVRDRFPAAGAAPCD